MIIIGIFKGEPAGRQAAICYRLKIKFKQMKRAITNFDTQ
jgi:hypothetical protein